jgi:RND family efflux transporter MFP subunit
MAAFLRSRYPLLWAVALALVALPFAAAADKESADDTEELSPQQRLELFHKETPAGRLRLVEKLPRSGDEFHKVTVGNVVATLLERGSLEPAGVSDVVCRVKARGKGNTTATTIKWVIDEGTFVKQGERVVELDESAIREQVGLQKVAHEQAAASKAQAEEDLKVLRKSKQVDVRLGEIALRLAELELKKAGGADKDQQEVLELRVEKARLELERTNAQAKANEKQHEVELRARSALAAQEATRLSELEEEVKRCVLTAPRDGLAMYFVPEQSRFGAANSIIAQGEPVREGQRLLRICDLKRMLVSIRIHEALIARVRPGQKVTVRVDAFPRKPLAGTVTQVATVASQPDWFSSDVKVYQTLVALADEVAGLKPGMSAEVTIVLEERVGVVQVPVSAVVRAGKERVCYVKTTDGIEERRVVTGVSSDLAVEIKDGLKEGDHILRDPRGLLRRLYPPPAKGDGPPAGRLGAAGLKATDVLVRSVNPARGDGSVSRTRVMTYGLTYDDLKHLGAVEEVREVVPMRVFPCEVRRLDMMKPGRVVATTPALADAAGLKLEAGRYLREEDGEQTLNVAVLGSAIAKALFPDVDPLGESIRVGNYFYRVVGVFREQEKGAAGLLASEVNDAVYLPLQTCRVRFGERILIRQAGSVRAEEVPLSAVLVRAARPERLRAVAEAIRGLLEAAHKQQDWEVVTPAGR